MPYAFPTKREFAYSVSLTSERIEREELITYLKKRKTVVFVRDNEGVVRFNKALFSDDLVKLLAARILDCKPVLTLGAQLNVNYLSEAFDFFARGLIFQPEGFQPNEDGIGQLLGSSNAYRKFLLSLLRVSDLSIDDISERKEKVQFALPLNLPFSSQGNPQFNGEINRVFSRHVIDGKTHELGLYEESLGTQKVMALSGLFFNALNNGLLLVIDEFGSSLHHELATYLLSLFFDPDVNKTGAQILFNSHDLLLMDEGLLRRDQIVFTERDREKGTTFLSPLAAYSVRKSDDVLKGYLAGRYVDLPYIGEECLEL